jgi:hypothetical protein
MWCWQSLDKTTTLPLVPDGGVKKLKQNFDLCVTGEVRYLKSLACIAVSSVTDDR